MTFDLNKLSGRERAVKQAIRNFLYPLTLTEMQVELDLSIAQGDALRTKWIVCYMDECRMDCAG